MSKGERTLGVRAGTRAATTARSAVAPADLAWLLVLPCALVLVAAIALLGPPLGSLLFPPKDIAFWNTGLPTLAIRPEPTEQARYLIAVAGPAALSGLVLLLRGRPLPLRPATAAVLVQLSQLLLAATAVAAIVAQYRIVYDERYSGSEPFRRVYFTPATLVVAALLTVLAVVVLRREAWVERIRRLARETDRRRVVGFALAIALLVLWLLTAVNTEGSIGATNDGVHYNISFWTDEAYAVLDGRYPLVDFHAQYSHLWPYLSAAVMWLLGPSFGVYATVMVIASGLTLLAVYALFRRLVHSSLLALALFAPFLATGFFMEIGPPGNRYGPSNLFSMFPMRYGGPYVVAWLLVRHVDRLQPRRAALLFAAAGVTLLNNVEFGLPAFAATFGALLWSDLRPWRTRVGLLARDAALGLAAAVLLVILLTLVVAGSLPHLSYLFTFSKLWGLGGVTMLPMPTLGLHLALYATFAAALVVATVRALERAEQRSLTAMLAWSAIFGLGASSYFAGRSHPEVLISLFSAWALALALLLVVVVRAISARSDRRPTVAEVALLAGCALAICSLAQLPLPWSQLERLGHTTRVPDQKGVPLRRFVIEARPKVGEKMLLLAPLGHRVAYDLGLKNVSPYVGMISMPAREQLDEALAVARAEGVIRVILYLDQSLPAQQLVIQRSGYVFQHGVKPYAQYVLVR